MLKRYIGIDDLDDLIESQGEPNPSWDRLAASQEYYEGINALEDINYRIFIVKSEKRSGNPTSGYCPELFHQTLLKGD